MWFCHECNAEMRPLMVPDPHCASCNGTFVEKMEDPSDDPREFQHHSPGHFEPDHDPPGVDNFLLNLQTLMRGDTRPSNPNQTFDRRNPVRVVTAILQQFNLDVLGFWIKTRNT